MLESLPLCLVNKSAIKHENTKLNSLMDLALPWFSGAYLLTWSMSCFNLHLISSVRGKNRCTSGKILSLKQTSKNYATWRVLE